MPRDDGGPFGEYGSENLEQDRERLESHYREHLDSQMEEHRQDGIREGWGQDEQ